MADVYALLLAGGRGSRFWPLSRKKLPKQCLHLDGDLTLLGQTFARSGSVVNAGNTLVLTGGDMEQPVRAALPGLPADSFLVEPSGRNTAPCIAWGGHEVGRRTNGEGIVVVLPADHRIGRPDAFRDSIRQAIRLAKETGDIVTLGIQPNRPETGYGYLELGESVQVEGVEARTVSKFVKSPIRNGRHVGFRTKRICGMRAYSCFGWIVFMRERRHICRQPVRRWTVFTRTGRPLRTSGTRWMRRALIMASKRKSVNAY